MSDNLSEERRAAHKAAFEQYLNQQYKKEDSTSLIIDKSKYNLIISYLNETIEKPDPSKKFYFKKQKFNIQIIENQPRLYREFKKRNNTNNLPVAVKEDYFEILYDVHSVQRGHIGINKMEHQLSIRFYGIPRNIVAQFIKFCPICNLKLTQMTQPRIKPIRSDDFFSRIQIDLVDMRHRPATHKAVVYQWIAHVIDHFTKFHILWAQEHKCAEEVAEGLERYVFSLFGLPGILQADNGTEFKNALVAGLIESWDGNCKTIHGRPRHPQSQGLVEQGNGTLERMLAAMLIQYNTNDWVALIPKIQFNLNTQQSSSTKCTPYEVVFNIQPNLGNEKQIVEIVNENNEEIERIIERNDLTSTANLMGQDNQQFIQSSSPDPQPAILEPVQITQEDVQVIKVPIRDTVRDNQEKASKKMQEKHLSL